MVQIEDALAIRRPVTDVFDYVTDPAKLAEWQDTAVAVTKETDGPMRAGTRLREVRRAPLGRRMEQLVEVSAYEPDRVFGLRVLDGPLKVDGEYRFAASADGTRLEFTGRGELHGPLRLLAPLATRALRRQFAGYHRRLKDRLEAQEAPATSASASGVRT
jgi:uncharacterized protein YndB with AHSA1/START domain